MCFLTNIVTLNAINKLGLIDCKNENLVKFDGILEKPVSITISTPTTWSNQTMTFLPGESITITPTGSLTLVNTTLTKQGNSNWHGVVIQGPTSNNPGGSIILSAGSKIEFAQNGIQANNGCNNIRVIDSELYRNSTAIVVGNTANQVKGNIFISNSVITSSTDQVGIVSNVANITVVNQSKLFGPGAVLGISSINNKLILRNSILKGHIKCISKEVGGARNNRGLFINHCYIHSSADQAIINMDALVDVQNSLIVGTTRSFGTSTGKWYANNFSSNQWLRDSKLSHEIHENCFNNSFMKLDNDQTLTNATCNTWYCGSGINENSQPCHPLKIAVDALGATKTRLSWNNVRFEEASGNKWINERLTMRSAAANIIRNFHIVADNQQVFNYQMQFTGVNYVYPNSHSVYNLWPNFKDFEPVLTSINEISYNDTENNNLWISLNQERTNVINQIANASPTELLDLQIKLEGIEIQLGQSVLLALKNEDESMTESSYNIWISRANPLLERRALALQLFMNESFVELISNLNSINFSSIDQADVYQLIASINWMSNAKSSGKNLLDLNSSDLDVLIGIANSSFGDYTAILRGWLAINYNIFIYPPEVNNLKKSNENFYSAEASLGVQISSIRSPNCILISSSETNFNFYVEIFDLSGKEMINKKIVGNKEQCIEHSLSSGIYLMRLKNLYTSECSLSKIFID